MAEKKKRIPGGELKNRITDYLESLQGKDSPIYDSTLAGISNALYGSPDHVASFFKQITKMSDEGSLKRERREVLIKNGRKIKTFVYSLPSPYKKESSEQSPEPEYPQDYRLAARVAEQVGAKLESRGMHDAALIVYKEALAAIGGEKAEGKVSGEPPRKEISRRASSMGEPPVSPPTQKDVYVQRKLSAKLKKSARDLEGEILRGNLDAAGENIKYVIEYFRKHKSGTAKEIAEATGMPYPGVNRAINGNVMRVGLWDLDLVEPRKTIKVHKGPKGRKVYYPTEMLKSIPVVLAAESGPKNVAKKVKKESKKAGNIFEINPIERMIAVYGAEPEEGKEAEDFGIYNATTQNILKFFKDNPSATMKQLSKKVGREYETVFLLVNGREGAPGLLQAKLVKRVERGKRVEYRRTKRFERFFRDSEKKGYEFDDETSLKGRLYYPESEENLEQALQAYSSFSPMERVALGALQKADSLTLEKLSRKLHLNAHMAGAVLRKLEESGAVGKIAGQRKKGQRYYSVSPAYTKAVKKNNKNKRGIRSQPEPEISESGIDSDVYQGLKNKSEGGVSSVSVFRNLLEREKNQATVYDIADYYGIRVSQAEKLLESLEAKSLVHKKRGKDKIPYYKVQKWITRVRGMSGEPTKEVLSRPTSDEAAPPAPLEQPPQPPPAPPTEPTEN